MIRIISQATEVEATRWGSTARNDRIQQFFQPVVRQHVTDLHRATRVACCTVGQLGPLLVDVVVDPARDRCRSAAESRMPGFLPWRGIQPAPNPPQLCRVKPGRTEFINNALALLLVKLLPRTARHEQDRSPGWTLGRHPDFHDGSFGCRDAGARHLNLTAFPATGHGSGNNLDLSCGPGNLRVPAWFAELRQSG